MDRDYKREVDQGTEGVTYHLDQFGVLDEESYLFPGMLPLMVFLMNSCQD